MELCRELYDCVLFRDMERERAADIISKLSGYVRGYQKHEIVVSEQSVVRDVGVLISGEICKVRYHLDGTEQMVQKLKKSFMVGLEVAVSQKKTSPYSLYASQPSEVFWFPVRQIQEAGNLKDMDRIFLYQRIVYFLADEDIRKYRHIELLSSGSVREKIEKYMEIQKNRHHSDVFDIDFNREQLRGCLR